MESPEFSASNSLHPHGLDADVDDRPSFVLRRQPPPPVARLWDIARNFYWSWHPEGALLFREADPSLWLEVEQHPIALLNRVSEHRLWQLASNEDYVRRVFEFAAKQDAYLADATGPEEARYAYFCAEYGVHNSLPNYSGGLGILAGDHLKSASDLGLPLIAVGLLYRYGYFRQDIAHDGWQEEHYNDVFQTDLALTPVTRSDGSRMEVMIHIRGREVRVIAWRAQVGRIPLFLLDTNHEENSEVDRLITGHLYGGDTETRIVQEKVLGIGGVRMLRRLGISPEVFHLNEGHSAFLTLELATEYIAEHPDVSFDEAQKAVTKKCVFTTHTPVAAGNDVFPVQTLSECFSPQYISALKLSNSEFLALGKVNAANEKESFGMTPFALRMCRSANGVSKKHGQVSRELWKSMFPAGKVPITHVTNGVHHPTWISSVLQRLYAEKISPDWASVARNEAEWEKAVGLLSDDDIWTAHQTLKNLLIAYVRMRSRRKETGPLDTINERTETAGLFSPDVLTVGFARRIAQYKRWNLLLSDLDRLLRMVDDRERPVQFVFAGKAHPQDRTAKQILQEIMRINHDSTWQKRAVFIEDYDQEAARYLVQGVDVWLNVPRRPHEASGTSGMKTAMNGVLNFSILDGWWIEGFNGRNGFSIGGLDEFENDDAMDSAESEALYTSLESEVIPQFYEKDKSGIPTKWVQRMRNSIATLTPRFSSDRMVSDYVTNIYSSS